MTGEKTMHIKSEPADPVRCTLRLIRGTGYFGKASLRSDRRISEDTVYTFFAGSVLPRGSGGKTCRNLPANQPVACPYARCNDMHITVNEKRFSGNGNGERGDRKREPELAGRGENLTKLQPAAAAANPPRLLSSSRSMTS